MTIIIETPQPPIRERLVLVREGEPMAPRRDTEPADLERAGWVEEHLLVTARAEMRELGSERDEVRLILDASAGETTADAATRLHNDWVDARERADRVERERAVGALSERAKLAAAERERDEARAALATWQGSAEQERARCVAYLRAKGSPNADRIERGEHAKAEAPKVDLPWDADGILARAERVRAEREPVQDLARATDEELCALADTALEGAGPSDVWPHVVARAVAERVRREDTLARCVEAGLDVAIVEAHDDAERPGLRYIVRITESGGEETEATVPAADVPATLARLLGEVTR